MTTTNEWRDMPTFEDKEIEAQMTQDEIILAQQARIEQLRSLLFNAHGVFDDGEDIGNYRLVVSFGVADTLCGQIEEALEFQDDLSALRAHDVEWLERYRAEDAAWKLATYGN